MIARDVEGKVDWFSAGAGQIECLNGEMIGFDKTGIMVRIFSLHFKEIFGNYFNKNKSVDLCIRNTTNKKISACCSAQKHLTHRI